MATSNITTGFAPGWELRYGKASHINTLRNQKTLKSNMAHINALTRQLMAERRVQA